MMPLLLQSFAFPLLAGLAATLGVVPQPSPSSEKVLSVPTPQRDSAQSEKKPGAPVLGAVGVRGISKRGCPSTGTPLASPAHPQTPGGGTLISRLSDFPLTYAASGNPCLGPIPVYRLTLRVSGVPAASTHEMARRLAPALEAYSRKTRFEGCARMCMTPQGKVVARAVTIRSHVSCVAPKRTCPEGSIPTQETIHSHPPGPVFVANAVDLAGWGLDQGLGEVMWIGDPNEPSEEDRVAAPLWLVGADGRLRWLEGPDAATVARP